MEETQKYIPPPPRRPIKKADKLSRRQFLLGLGLLGAGAVTCGGLGLSAAILGSKPTESPTAIPPSPEVLVQINTAAPRYQKPITISRDIWGALPPDHTAPNENGFYSEDNLEGWRVYEDDLENIYQTILIHHAAFYEETDLNTVRAVQSLHFSDRGWADIGYHYCIGQTGIIYEGRDWNVRGTHVEGYNTGSLGICLLGNFMQQSPTAVQLESCQALINWASERLTISHIASHRHFNPQTECPGDNLFIYMGQFAAVAGLELGTAGYVAPEHGFDCPCCCSPKAI